jgi:hypothetical protein
MPIRKRSPPPLLYTIVEPTCSVAFPLDMPWGRRSSGRDPLRLAGNDSFAESGLEVPQILADQVQVGAELPRVFQAMLTHFLNVWIFHDYSPRKASGDTISGYS